ncbi:MAG: Flagellar hook-associated protein 3 [Pseudomonadota bacterium]|jgi:flagellar hook-associated protein 3 FlgL|nr:Flagellar hook-associated protein 3 [Pseudomonadota bacterium]
MRISTAYPQQFNINSMANQQAQLTNTQAKISSGQKYLTPSENPSAAAYSLSFKESIALTEQYQENIAAANQRLGLEETALANVSDTIQRLQELGLQGVSDSGNSTISRNAIASEFDQLNDHLISLANTRNANGEYIFAGNKSTTMPYSKIAVDPNAPATDAPLPAFAYAGSSMQRAIQVGMFRTITDGDVGSAVFGSTEEGESVFDAIKNFTAELRADKPTLETLKKIDDALVRVTIVHASIGARQNALDRQKATNDDFIINTKTALSNIADLDMADAITKLNSQQNSLQAAQQSFAKVQGMSLFKFL